MKKASETHTLTHTIPMAEIMMVPAALIGKSFQKLGQKFQL